MPAAMGAIYKFKFPAVALIQTLLICLLSNNYACAAEVDYEHWQGSFGELVRRLSDFGERGKDPLRTGDLMVSAGYLADGLSWYKQAADWDEMKKEPAASQLAARIAALQKRIDSTGYVKQHFTTQLNQLSKPRGECHIREMDLPAQYQQAASEERFNEVRLFSGAQYPELAQYPALAQYRNMQRFWSSADKQRLGCLLYNALGELALVSTNGGKQWLGPLYLGMHRLPDLTYLILHDSKLPLINNGNLQLEVTIWKKDKSKPGSPILGYKYFWKKWQKVLVIPLDALLKDSDRDGLTDLFEERILTDPYDPDTDHDGIPDAIDNQPLNPFPKKLTIEDEVLLAALGQTTSLVNSLFSLESQLLNHTRLRKDPSGFLTFQSELTKEGIQYYTSRSTNPIPLADNSIFICSETDVFRSITGNQRMIVLNKAASAQYTRKFGEEFDPYAARVELFLESKGTRAYLDIRHSSRGANYVFEKRKGLWWSREISTSIYD